MNDICTFLASCVWIASRGRSPVTICLKGSLQRDGRETEGISSKKFPTPENML